MGKAEKDKTSDKGNRAKEVTKVAILCEWIPFGGKVKEITDLPNQILGIDLMSGPIKIQVKCDFEGGPKELGGTGNLFLQIAERNNTGEH